MQRGELALQGGAPASETVVRLAKPYFGEGCLGRVREVLSSGVLREGGVTREFEERFSRRVGARHGVAVCNGTAALSAAYSCALNPGDEVVVPAFTYEASAGAAVRCGARPVFADVSMSTFLIDVESLAEKISSRTRAILPVHLFGNVAEMGALNEVAEDHGLCVIGDCCQAIGSRYMGRGLGEVHDMCCYSFYPSKVITTGEGGMVTANDPEHAEWIRGFKSPGSHQAREQLGVNYRFDDVRAALGLDQLDQLDAFISRRRRIAREYDRVVGGLGCVVPQRVEPHVESCFNYYTVKLDLEKLRCGRDGFVEALRAENIECGVYYPSPLTRHPSLGDGSTCPNAEELSRSVLSLPMHPFLGKHEIEAVAEALGKVVSHFLR
jgi:dTDP-4-amino-4,6-dideoxygalactose transaminase